MKILKFGGSSVESAEKIKKVMDIIVHAQEVDPPIAVVVSAFGDVTDHLIGISTSAAKGDIAFEQRFKRLETKHLDAVKASIGVSHQSHILANLK